MKVHIRELTAEFEAGKNRPSSNNHETNSFGKGTKIVGNVWFSYSEYQFAMLHRSNSSLVTISCNQQSIDHNHKRIFACTCVLFRATVDRLMLQQSIRAILQYQDFLQ